VTSRTIHACTVAFMTFCLTSGGYMSPVSARGCPDLIGRWPYGPAYAVAASGEYAFFGSGSALMIADVSDPTSTQLVGEIGMQRPVRGLAVSGGHAFVAIGSHGMRVIDVSDPSVPVEVGAYVRVLSDTYDVAVSGGYAYITDGPTWGLQVVDVSTPSSPVVVGGYYAPTLDLALASGHVFVTEGWAGLEVFHTCTLFSDDFESGGTSTW